MNQRLMTRVTVPRRTTAKNPAFGDQQRIAALRRILLDDQIATSVRVTAGLVLVFGQPVNRIAALRDDQVRIANGTVLIQLAHEWLTVPEPFAALLAVYHAHRPGQQTAANSDSP